MATTPTILRNATDTCVGSLTPNTNWSTNSRMGISAVSTNITYPMIYFAMPFPKGVTILNATLTLTQQNDYAGSVTWSVQRIASAWSASRVTYNNRPGVTGTVVSLTKSAPVRSTQWSFDVTSLIQSVSNGAAWYGFRLSTTSTAYNWIWSTQAPTSGVRPVLSISWADNPKAPTQLYPSGGRAVSLAKPTLQCNFVDVSGDTTMQAIQVQLDTPGTFTTPLFDSGTVLTSVPELDLSTTAFAGLAADQTVYWRARVQDGAGLWSNWSAPTTFVRKTRGTLTLNNPAVSPNNFVSEATPPIDWTFTGRTQKAYQVVITDGVDLNKWLWTSGKVTGTTTVITLPANVLRYNNQSYQVIVYIWDDIDRENTPGDPIPTSVSRVFTYQYDATVTPVTSLAAAPHAYYPRVQLTWSRATQPDRWNVYRNNKLIGTGLGADYFVSGTSYSFWDYLPEPRTQQTYTVVAVVNNKGSSPNPTVSTTPNNKTTTLSSKDGVNVILIWNADTDMDLQETSGVYTPAGNGAPVLITQSERGYAGTVKGRLAGFGTITSQQFRDAFKQLMKFNGQTLLLTVANDAFECIIYNATYKPVVKNEEVVYDISFNFFQTDYVP